MLYNWLVIQDDYSKIFGNKQKILVVFSHPDDLEVMCGGLVARLIKDGKEVRSVKVTSGDMGSGQEQITDLGNKREQEDRAAMQELGVVEENNVYLRFGDGTLQNNQELIGALVLQIRTFKPDIIITHNPENVVIRFGNGDNWINHRDHRNTGLSTIDAAYPFSRDRNFFPEQFKDKKVTSHLVKEFLIVDYYDHPDLVYFDVTNFVETRVKAHAKHASQYSLEAAQEAADYFTIRPEFPEGKRFESFRHVVAD